MSVGYEMDVLSCLNPSMPNTQKTVPTIFVNSIMAWAFWRKYMKDKCWSKLNPCQIFCGFMINFEVLMCRCNFSRSSGMNRLNFLNLANETLPRKPLAGNVRSTKVVPGWSSSPGVALREPTRNVEPFGKGFLWITSAPFQGFQIHMSQSGLNPYAPCS